MILSICAAAAHDADLFPGFHLLTLPDAITCQVARVGAHPVATYNTMVDPYESARVVGDAVSGAPIAVPHGADGAVSHSKDGDTGLARCWGRPISPSMQRSVALAEAGSVTAVFWQWCTKNSHGYLTSLLYALVRLESVLSIDSRTRGFGKGFLWYGV